MLIPYKFKALILAWRTFFLKFQRANDLQRWKDYSELLPDWDSRTELIASFIPKGMSVLEFGAGRMVLKKYLVAGCKYTPSDLVDRGNGTIVCDLNAKELPVFQPHDVAVFSGVLEYIFDITRLVCHISKSINIIVTSYAPTDISPGKLNRRMHGWVNDYNMAELENIFEQQGFHCDKIATWHYQRIYRFILGSKIS